MDVANCNSGIVNHTWFQDDYRNSSKFRSQMSIDQDSIGWSGIEPANNSDLLETKSKNSQRINKYGLVIVLPASSSSAVEDSASSKPSLVQTDSGIASESPSPPKTPSPDYYDFDLPSFSQQPLDYEDAEETKCHKVSPAKKVHFCNEDDDDEPSMDKLASGTKSSWRDALTMDLDAMRTPLTHCYRSEWAWESRSQRFHRGYSNRCNKKTRNGKTRDYLESRTCSLDRCSSRKSRHRTPLLCDPDPLKAPWNSAGAYNKKSKHERNQDCSSHKPVERASCGPGPPVKQLRSYSVDTQQQQSYGTPQICRSRQRSVSGNVASKKTPVRRVDEDALKRSRLHNSQYELSQDLLDKQVEMLERKYGGDGARKAALTIQRAFRKYTIMKRFQDIANASKGEKRLSRRFPTFDVDSNGKEWMMYNGNNGRYGQCYENENNGHCKMMYNGDSQTTNNFYNRDGHDDLASQYVKPCRTQSFRERRIRHQEAFYECCPEDATDSKDVNSYYYNHHNHHYNSRSHVDNAYYHDSFPTPVTRSPPSFPRHPAWTAVPTSNSQQRTHVSPHVISTHLNSSPKPALQHQDATQQQLPARESVSSEDSALSSMSVGENDITVDERSLHRGSSTRHSLNVPTSPSKQRGNLVPLQRNAVRASDVALGRRIARQVEQKKIPPQVPKRTSSIPGRDSCKNDEFFNDNTPMSEGSQLSLLSSKSTTSRTCNAVDASPVWKRKSLVLAEQSLSADDKRLSNISENSEDSMDGGGGYSNTPPADMSHSFNAHNYPDIRTPHDISGTPLVYKLTEIQRKRQYRVGLNLFNKKPERGVRYLIHRGFLEASPQAVARFLLTRKGLSKQMIGEYLGNLQNSFNMAVLECFVRELDLAGMQVDVALRKFQTFFRMPGEAQKIERLVEVFSHRYIDCNHDIASKFHNPDTVFVLAFAIIMLNTDLHTPNMKAERRMKIDEFIRNLRSIDDGHDLDRGMLVGIYERIKTNEFKMGSDHVTQVLKVQQTIVGKKPNLALSHRRLVCYCRLYEVYDVSKKERPGVHQREVFLFNDTLMVTKIFSKKKSSVTYTFRQSFPLCGMSVTLFEAPYYPHGIRLSQRVDDKVLITFNARNEHDRSKFVEDLKESILEMDEMENLRIEGELEKQKIMRVRGTENRDSGVADMEIIPQTTKDGKLSPESTTSNGLKRSALSNSLLDLHEQQISKPVRRGSAGSLDSGMSISFQSSAASSVSHDSSPQIVHASSTSSGSGSSLSSTRSGVDGMGPGCSRASNQPGFLGGLFGKKGKHTQKSNLKKSLESSDM